MCGSCLGAFMKLIYRYRITRYSNLFHVRFLEKWKVYKSIRIIILFGLHGRRTGRLEEFRLWDIPFVSYGMM